MREEWGEMASGEAKHAYWELARLFLKLGLTAFGGPAAHTAMMEEEVVQKRKWLSRGEFLDLVGAVNLIPGPNSTELAIHIGRRQAGWAGWLIAGACFILPAAVLCTVLAWAYKEYGRLPDVQHAFYGIKPVIIAVVAQALWRLGLTAVKSRMLAVLGAGGAIVNLLGVHELAALFGTALLAMGWGWVGRGGGLGGSENNRPDRPQPAGDSSPRQSRKKWMLGFGLLGLGFGSPGVGAAAGFSLVKLFLFFLKVGSVLFGSGYVLLAFLRADLVERWGWLTEAQLLDAIAVGQFTPGPVFTTATFIGYLLGGTVGAVLATAAIFLPAFVFVALTGSLIAKLRASPTMSAFLDGVNVASLALMGVVTWHLARGSVVDVWTAGLAALSAYLLIRWKTNSAWLVLGGALLGMIFK